MFDQDTLSEDDLLGRLSIPLSTVRSYGPGEGAKWHNLWSPFAPSADKTKERVKFVQPAVMRDITCFPLVNSRASMPKSTCLHYGW